MKKIPQHYPNLFKSRYPDLSGKTWILTVDIEDRKAFNELGRKHSQFGRLGGKARSKTALRDEKGKFKPNEIKKEGPTTASDS